MVDDCTRFTYVIALSVETFIALGHFKSNKERQLCKHILIVKYNCHKNGLDKDKSFLSNYRTLSYM